MPYHQIVGIAKFLVDLHNVLSGLCHRNAWTYFTVLGGLSTP